MANDKEQKLPDEKKVVPAPEVPVVPQPASDEVAELRKLVEAQSKTIADMQETFRAVADKTKLDAFEDKKKQKTGKVVRVSTYNDKLIVAWTKLTENKVVKLNGIWHEIQKTNIIYQDGDVENVDFATLQRDKRMVDAIVEGEFKDVVDGETVQYFKVQTKEFGQFNIDIKFIN